MLTRVNWVNDVGYVSVGGANLERNSCAQHESRVLTSDRFRSRQSAAPIAEVLVLSTLRGCDAFWRNDKIRSRLNCTSNFPQFWADNR